MTEVIGMGVCINTDEMKQAGKHSGQIWNTNFSSRLEKAKYREITRRLIKFMQISTNE